MNSLQEKILALKKEKDALIIAHYYQTLDVQEIADVVGDSFEMAQRAANANQETLVVCGVHFMAESAKILSPEKTVLLPRLDAGCPMANMVTPEDVAKLRKQYPGAAVVCYVNTSATVKAVSDVCCTSSSAVKIVRALPEKQIIFVPDQNLGAYVASQVPEKEIILYDGCCPIHHFVTESDAIDAKKTFPKAKLLAHPECRPEVLAHADYIGSTKGIINEATSSEAGEFIIGTEVEIAELLRKRMPEKSFYPLRDSFICPNMKKTRLSDIINALENGEYEITPGIDVIKAAKASLERMVALGKV